MSIARLGAGFAVFAALVVLPSGCTDSSDVDLLEIDARGALSGLVYRDNNGNGALDGTDLPMRDIVVALTALRGGATVESAKTDSTGVFRMTDVAVGTYRLALDPVSLGDSLEAIGGPQEMTVRLTDTARVDFGVSYASLSFDEIRSTQEGRRVFTSGIALNPRPNFSDGVVHLQYGASWLRTTNVARGTINTGDSIRVLGRTKLDNGQMVLDQVTSLTLVSVATIPQPLERTTGVAASAGGGALDAALLRVRAAEILDTATVDGDFGFRVDDGSGPVLVVLRSFLQLNTGVVRPDTILRVAQATGLLTPRLDATGATAWRLLPRSAADLTFEVKYADLGVVLERDAATVHRGDTLEVRVIVANAGPLGASGVHVASTILGGLSFVSASATRGTYVQATGTWSLDSLAVGGKDTLRLKVSARDAGLGSVEALVRPPTKQVDPNGANDRTTLTIQVAPQPAPGAGVTPGAGA